LREVSSVEGSLDSRNRGGKEVDFGLKSLGDTNSKDDNSFSFGSGDHLVECSSVYVISTISKNNHDLAYSRSSVCVELLTTQFNTTTDTGCLSSLVGSIECIEERLFDNSQSYNQSCIVIE
jgi:hypothetical protein